MRARELRLMAVAMGGLALVVAARGGEGARQDAVSDDSSGASDVVAGTETDASAGGLASGLNELVSGRAIRLLDFEEIDQRGSACDEALSRAPDTIRVTQGESALLDEDMLVRLEVAGNAIYGDLDGDGSDEAAVHTVCEYGANGTQDQIQVWDLQAGAVRPKATLDRPPAEISEGLPPRVQGVTVEGGNLVVTWEHYSDDAPNCCPDRRSTMRYEVTDDGITRVGDIETTQIG